jgi:hypothetical protein
MAEQTVRLEPVPSILVESLRDIGYSLNSALADVIDNSIAANATEVRIFAIPGDDFRIAIIDNGEGLSREKLKQAMRLGSSDPRQERELNDLGRFGLGLKTASFSQCRRLTVLSCTGEEKGAAFTWDLDYVVRENQWAVIEELNIGSIPFAKELGHSGTLVLWEKLDRLAGVRGVGKVDHTRVISEVEDYLSLVFHRYLSGEKGVNRLAISVNNRPLVPVDPFNTCHKATQAGQRELICPGVTMQAFTLPHRSHYESQHEYERSGLPGGYLRNQGVYLYRAKRLILHGTWFGLSRKTALTQLTRVKIDIDVSQDELWKIDVKKVSAQIPEEVRKRLKSLLATIGAPSRKAYSKRAARLTSPDIYPAWNAERVGDRKLYKINRTHPVIVSFLESLDSDLSTNLETVLSFIETNFPVASLFYDFANDEDSVIAPDPREEELTNMARTFFSALNQSIQDDEKVLSIMQSNEPFCSRWVETLQSLGIEEQ